MVEVKCGWGHFSGWLLVLFSLSLRSSYAKQRPVSPLAKPPVGIVLLEHSRFRPALAVSDGKFLYYSSATGGPICFGSDLYRVDLTQRVVDSRPEEEELWKVSCVVGLSLEKGELWVRFRELEGEDITKAGREVKIARLVDGKLRDETDSIRQLASARAKFKYYEVDDGGSEIGEYRQVSYHQHDGTWILSGVRFVTDEPMNWFYLDQMTADGKAIHRLPTRLPWDASDSAREIDIKSNGTSVAMSFQEAESGRVYLGSNKGKDWEFARLGSEMPLERGWKSCAAAEWFVRHPRYLTLVDGGFVVFDQTTRITESKAISFFSSANTEFYRIQIPSQDIGGISSFGGGIIVSRPETGHVVWYGSKASAFRGLPTFTNTSVLPDLLRVVSPGSEQ